MLGACGGTASSAGRAEPHPAAADVRYLLREFERTHPKPFPGRRAMRAEGNALIRKLPALDADGVLVGLMRVVAAAGEREGHSGLFPLDPDHRRQLRVYPLALYWFDDGVYVTSSPTRPELVGRKLLSVAGKPVDEVLRAVRPLVSRDNSWTLRLHAPELLTVAEVLRGLGIVERAGPVAYGLEGGEVTLAPQPAPAFRSLIRHAFAHGFPVGLPLRERPAAVRRRTEQIYTERLAGGRVLYVGFNQTYSYPASVVEEVERAARAGRRVVVDVRYNGGGDNTTYFSLVYALAKVRDVVLLTGPETFSAAKDFVGDVEQTVPRARRVGQPTGGSPNQWGDRTRLRLPRSGWSVHVPTRWVEKGRGPGDRRVTFPPDVRVPNLAADYFAGRDPVLERALALQ